MTPLRNKMIRELELQRKSKNTIKAYTRAIKELAQYFNRTPERISYDEIRDYVHHLITQRRLAHASVNVKLSAIMFLYRNVLGHRDFALKIYSKPSGSLPQPFSRDEIERIIAAATNNKHRTMIMVAKEKAGVRTRGGIHGLRHAFATHLLEGGVVLQPCCTLGISVCSLTFTCTA